MDYKHFNDYEILYLVREHQEDAEQLLYEKYRPLIQSLAYKYYKRVKNKGYEVVDFVQEGYIGLHRAIEKYSVSKNCLFYTFAMVCIERQMQVVARRLCTFKQEILNHTSSYDYVIPDLNLSISDVICDVDTMGPEDALLDEEYLKRLIQFRNDLPFVCAQVFELRWNGFHHIEIANLLDLSKKSVDSYLVRIRRRLRQRGFYKSSF